MDLLVVKFLLFWLMKSCHKLLYDLVVLCFREVQKKTKRILVYCCCRVNETPKRVCKVSWFTAMTQEGVCCSRWQKSKPQGLGFKPCGDGVHFFYFICLSMRIWVYDLFLALGSVGNHDLDRVVFLARYTTARRGVVNICCIRSKRNPKGVRVCFFISVTRKNSQVVAFVCLELI